MKILIVEDELRLAAALRQILTDAGYEAHDVADGGDGLTEALTGAYDLMILDVMLPGMNGWEVVRSLRRKHSLLPVLMLTARSEVADRVAGLDAGADDYLTKPFAEAELLARIRALLRRGDQAADDQISRFDLVLTLSVHTLSCRGRQLELNSKEFQLMRLLMTTQDRCLSKEELLNRVWGLDADVSENCVEAYISFLRKKLAYLESNARIVALRSVGYRLKEEEAC